MSFHDAIREALQGLGPDALVQTAASLVLVGVVLLLARALRAGLGTEPAWAALRALGQVVIVGFLLTALLSLHVGWAGLVLLVMAAIAAGISRKRARSPQAFPIAFVSIAAGTALVVAVMLATKALEPTVRDLVPVGSIFVATCMRTASLAFERYDREEATGGDAVPAAVEASLIPAVDGMRSLGFVWIPGVMTGLILAGASPVQAAFLQFAVVALGFVAAAVTSLAATAWLARQAVQAPAGNA